MADDTKPVRDQLEAELHQLIQQRTELNAQIARYEGALASLDGRVPAQRRTSPSVRGSVLAALGTFKSPVHTSRLLDHELLVHYSRHTLRSALADLHRAGEIEGERAPKGFIWNPKSVNGHGA